MMPPMTCVTRPAFPATDPMIARMVTSALSAGLAAGLFAALLHFAFVQKYILLGEEYESGAAVHYAGVADEGEAAGHDHDHAAGAEAEHSDDPTPQDGGFALKRNAFTALFDVLVYCGYGLMLAAGFSLATHYGRVITAREGLLWGIAGYAAFQLAPAMGLAPELPGTLAADLTQRQVWWAATALSTAAALALIGYGRGWAMIGAAILLLALPHLIGAPGLDRFTGVAPPEVAASFAARSLGIGLSVWALLGWLAGWFWSQAPA
jgi:cobalt transporter subunit CbtA